MIRGLLDALAVRRPVPRTELEALAERIGRECRELRRRIERLEADAGLPIPPRNTGSDGDAR